MSYTFKAHVIITGQIKCLTGLHIGGTEEGYEIGGMDNPIIKDKITGYPYIPGSSIKGKMRSAMEWILGKVGEKEIDGTKVREMGSVHVCQDPTCKVCRIFGTSADRKGKEGEAAGPTRLMVRDAFFAEGTEKDFEGTQKDERYVKDNVFMTELKTENSLNRITSAANPRPMERVPQGAKFDLKMTYGVYDMGDRGQPDVANLAQLATALEMLEAGALGGGGSRGSGQIKLENLTAAIKTLASYTTGTPGEQISGATPRELIGNVQAKVQAYLK